MVRLVIGQTADGSTLIAPLKMTSSRRFGVVPAARQGVKYEVPVRNGAHSDSNFRVMAPSIASSITTHFYAQQSDSEMNLSKRKFMAQSLGCAGSGCKSLAQQCKFLKAYRVGCCARALQPIGNCRLGDRSGGRSGIQEEAGPWRSRIGGSS